MSDVLIVFALIGVLVIGLVLGLVWRGSLLIGDRRSLDRLSAGIAAEQRMRAATHAAMQASRDAVREQKFGRRPGGGS